MWNAVAPLFKWSFWFSLAAVSFTPWIDKAILAVMGILLVTSAVLKFWLARQAKEKDTRRVFTRFAACAFWAGLSGLLLYGFTWQGIPVLSMRFWFLVWAVSFGWWAWTIAAFAAKEVPAMRIAKSEKDAYEKWLPKPKH